MRAESAEDERGKTGKTKAAEEQCRNKEGEHGGEEQKELGEKKE